MTDAINVIHQDHLNFDRLLTILENTVRGFAESYGPEDRKPNLDLLFTIVYYIRTFPDSIHHPKEEKYLFPSVCPGRIYSDIDSRCLHRSTDFHRKRRLAFDLHDDGHVHDL